MEQLEEQQVEVVEYEDQARKMGWKSIDEFDGPKEKHRTAQEFVEFNDKVAPMLKKHRDELKRELDELKQWRAGYQATVDGIIKGNAAKAAKEHKDTVDFLKAQLKKARSTGDTDLQGALEDELDTVRENPPKPTVVPTPQPQVPDLTEFNEWLTENSWYENDKQMRTYADAVGTKLRQDGNKTIGAAFFKAVEREVKADFPEKFQKRKPAVEGASAGTNTRSSGSFTYSSLPADARSKCDDFVSEKLGTREEYLRLYNA